MSTTMRRHPALLALCGALVLLGITASVGSMAKAEAATSPYCNNQKLGSYGGCTGAARYLYALNGWGDQHAVCVRTLNVGPGPCSGGAGQGVYWDPAGLGTWLDNPQIWNNAAGDNVVHGVAFS